MEKTKRNTTSTKEEKHQPEVKKLYRLPEEGKIAGVCAGLAYYLNVDVTIMRLIFVILALASGGFGVLVYFVLAILMPVKTNGKIQNQPAGKDIGDNINNLVSEIRQDGGVTRMRNYFGIALVLFGTWLLLLQFFPGWVSLKWSVVWPTALVILGLLLVVKGRK